MQPNFTKSRTLSRALEKSGYFDVISDIHRPKGVYEYLCHPKSNPRDVIEYNPGSPCVVFKLTDKFRKENPDVKQSDVSKLMLTRGWVVPNYALPPAQELTEVMRIVVRESLSEEMLARLITDITWTAASLAENKIEL